MRAPSGRSDVLVHAALLAWMATAWIGLGYFAARSYLAVVADVPAAVVGYGAMAVAAVVAAALLTSIAGDVL